MKKWMICVLCSLLLIPALSAQNKKAKQQKLDKMEVETIGYKNISLGVDFGYDFWLNSEDVVGPWKFNRSAGVFATYNLRIKESAFYFCPGVGFSFYNLYGNAMPEVVTNSDGVQTTHFVPIPDGVSYKKAKTTYNYLDIPVEFRCAIKEFQIGLGIKFSYLMSATAKYKGDKYKTDDITGTEMGFSVKERYSNFKGTEDWKMALQLRFGYNWIHVFASYPLTKIYKTTTNTETVQPGKMYPITVGVTIMPFRLRKK